MKKILFGLLILITGCQGVEQSQKGTYPLDTVPMGVGTTLADAFGNYINPLIKQTDTNTKDIALRLKIADTASMLSTYIDNTAFNSGLGAKLNISDTSTMLSTYLHGSDIAGKLNISDTANMLTHYIDNTGLNSALSAKVNVSDTATMLTNYALLSEIGIEYAQVVIVAKSGGNYTTIQGAINSISDATTTKRYVVKVQSGVYTETITLKDYVDIQGAGRNNTIIAGTSGTLLTYPATKCMVSGVGIVADYGTLGANTSAIVSGCADATLRECNLTVTKSGGDFQMHTVNLTGGILRMSDCWHAYTTTGATTDSHLTQSVMTQTVGGSILLMNSCEITASTTDTNDDLVGFETVAAATGTVILTNNLLEINAGAAGSSATGLWLYGTSDLAIIQRNRLVINCDAASYGLWVDSQSGGATIDTRHNEIIVTSAGEALSCWLASGDTWNSTFDKITAADGYTSSGTVLFASSDADGAFTATGTITANSFIGDLTGNASTVTNGVYTTDTATMLSTYANNSAIQTQLDGKIQADYVIEKVASTYYARPSGSYTAYSNADATIAIQDAIDALTSGGIIHIKEGFYSNLDSLVITHDSITIEGEGIYKTTLKLKDNYDVGRTPFGLGGGALFHLMASKHITFQNLCLDGNKANQTGQWEGTNTVAVLRGIDGSEYEGSAWDDPDYLLIDNCKIQGFTEFGLWLNNSYSSEIRNSIFIDNGENQIQISDLSSYCNIHDCILQNGGSVGISIKGSDNTMRDCSIIDGGLYAVGLETNSGDEIVTRCNLFNNYITGEGAVVGILIGPESRSCVVSGNIIYNIWGDGNAKGFQITQDSGSVIINNRVIKTRGYGIKLQGSIKMQISNNYFSGAGTTELNLSNESTDYSTDNFISGNYLYCSEGTSIMIDANCNDNIIMNNVLYGDWKDLNISSSASGTIWANNYGLKTASWLSLTGNNNLSVTATSDGLTTGLINSGSQNITITSSSADYIVALPTSGATTIGTRITGIVTANGCEMRVAVAQMGSVYINGVTTNVEAAIPANSSFEVNCIDATHWILKVWDANGVYSAPVPDAI